MKLTFLGTGTSTGVPQIGCQCPVCRSLDPCDRRLRASALLEVDGKRLLIDCGPDFRAQMLMAGEPRLDCALLTHSHYDHVGGVDDLRPYCADGPFPLYCRGDVADDLRARVPYCFRENPYPGVPSLDLIEIDPDRPFRACGIEVTPLPVMHARLPIVGFRVRDFAYITDCKTMPESTMRLLQGVDTLVLNALRHEEHPSHITLAEAIDIAARSGARRTYFTHFSHGIGRSANIELPDGMHMAHDMLSIEI